MIYPSPTTWPSPWLHPSGDDPNATTLVAPDATQAPPAGWSFVVCRPTGEPVGEALDARDRACTWRLNGVHSARLVLDLEDPLAVDLAAGMGRLKVYRSRTTAELAADPSLTSQLVFYGSLPAQGVREDAGAGTIEAVFHDPRWVLAERYSLGTETYSGVDQGAIAWGLVDTQNGRAGGDTWIREGGTTTGITRDRTYDRRPVLGLLDDLTQVINGPDIDIDPRDGWGEASPTRVMGNLRVYGQQGSDRPDVHLVYGAGLPSNVETVERSRLPVITEATITGTTEGTAPLESTYTVAAGSAYGLLESVESDPDLSVQSTLDQKVTGLVQARQAPVQVLSVGDLTADAPRPWEAFYLGDTVRVTARRGALQVNAEPFRIHGIEISIDPDGREQITLTAGDA